MKQIIKIKKQKGFTIIELMMVITIIGVIAAVAIPSIQNYMVKAQIQESLTLASGSKEYIINYYTEYGDLPADNTEVGYAGSIGKYVSAVNIDAGSLVVDFGNDANADLVGATLTLTPVEETEGNLSWICSSTAPNKYLPEICV